MDTVNNLELYDIYSVWHIPFWQTKSFYAVIATICFLTIAGLAVWLIVRYKQRKKPAKSPWHIALEQLRALQIKKYATKADGKLCYFAMTAIIKQYLHARFALDTTGKTDDELIKYLKEKNALPEDLMANLQDICKGCVFIKFANQEALQNQITQHLQMSIHLINKTIPQEKSN